MPDALPSVLYDSAGRASRQSNEGGRNTNSHRQWVCQWLLCCEALPKKKGLGQFHYVDGLRSLRAVLDREFYFVALVQAPIAFGLNRGKVDEVVFPAFVRDKAVTLRRVEPLDRARDAVSHSLRHLPSWQDLDEGEVQETKTPRPEVLALAIKRSNTKRVLAAPATLLSHKLLMLSSSFETFRGRAGRIWFDL